MSPEDRKDAQDTSLAALARGASHPQAAWLAGVSPSTFRRWCATDPGFAAQVAAEEHYAAEHLDAIVTRLAGATPAQGCILAGRTWTPPEAAV